MAAYFALVIIYPIISIALSLMLEHNGFFKTIKNEFYLWVGFTILFIGLFVTFLTGFKPMSTLVAFIVYTALYFAISVLRKVWYTESKDIFAKAHIKT